MASAEGVPERHGWHGPLEVTKRRKLRCAPRGDGGQAWMPPTNQRIPTEFNMGIVCAYLYKGYILSISSTYRKVVYNFWVIPSTYKDMGLYCRYDKNQQG